MLCQLTVSDFVALEQSGVGHVCWAVEFLYKQNTIKMEVQLRFWYNSGLTIMGFRWRGSVLMLQALSDLQS